MLQEDVAFMKKWSEISHQDFHPDNCTHVRIGKSEVENFKY